MTTPAQSRATMAHMLRPMHEVHAIYNQTHARLMKLVQDAFEAYELPPRRGRYPRCDKLSLADYLEHAHHGSIRWDRAASLATFVDMCRPRTMLEVGSFLGLSSHFFSRLMEPWSGSVVSVDPNIEHRCFPRPRRFYHRMNAGRAVHTLDAFWSARHNNSCRSPCDVEAIRKTSTVSPRYFTKRVQRFDMAFIDGAHDALAVWRDFKDIVTVMNAGGCVIFDDVDAQAWPGTFETVHRLQRWSLSSMRGTVLFGDQVAVFIDRGLVGGGGQLELPDRLP
jgi:predicted O-methyltransferase YrrM